MKQRKGRQKIRKQRREIIERFVLNDSDAEDRKELGKIRCRKSTKYYENK